MEPTGSIFGLREAVVQFLYKEARLADEHRYSEWESLWAGEDTRYWLPIGENNNPDEQISYINDNRGRLATRIRQLQSGLRRSQVPPSRMRRLISNVEVSVRDPYVEVTSNFVLFECRTGSTNTWVGQCHHQLIRTEHEFSIRQKNILLINNDEPLPNVAFLI